MWDVSWDFGDLVVHEPRTLAEIPTSFDDINNNSTNHSKQETKSLKIRNNTENTHQKAPTNSLFDCPVIREYPPTKYTEHVALPVRAADHFAS